LVLSNQYWSLEYWHYPVVDYRLVESPQSAQEVRVFAAVVASVLPVALSGVSVIDFI
jgi:hypothetical protein